MCGSHLCGDGGDSNTQSRTKSFCATSKVNYSLYLTYRTFYHVHLSKVKSTPLRTPIFARPIFTDRTGRLTKLHLNDYNVWCNLSDDIQLYINDFILVFLNCFIRTGRY